MPKEIKDSELFKQIAARALECRVKEGYRRVKTEQGTTRKKVLKIKARTRRYLYTIVFEDFEKGLEFARELKNICPAVKILDKHLQV